MLHSSIPLDARLLQALPFATPIGRLFAGLIALLLVVLVGRFVLRVAWKLVVVATVLAGTLFLLSALPSL